MKSNEKQYAPQGGYTNNRRMQSSMASTGPIINWAALWSRIWFFTKRIVAELWFLISRRKATSTANPYQQSASTTAVGFPLLRKWSLPFFKVSAVLVLFFYVMNRDIEFTIHMKAPFGTEATALNTDGAHNKMGFAQTVSFGGKKNKASQAQLDPLAVEDYIERFGPIARSEMKKYGIPASVKMAQAILASQAGAAPESKVDNNHFGVPMAGLPYESAWRNWREHSLLIINKYEQLMELGNDYRAWARGLEQLSYNKDANYANNLLQIIDRFHLEQLDESTI